MPRTVRKDDLIAHRDSRSQLKKNKIRSLCSPDFLHHGHSLQMWLRAESISKYRPGKPSWNDLQQQFTQMVLKP